MTKGNLLITAEGLETANIPTAKRDAAVLGFYLMKGMAQRENDFFYALHDVYSTKYSYGEFYPSFYNMSWDDFHQKKSLLGIHETTYELMIGFCKNPGIPTLQDEAEFMAKNEPRAYSGYSNPKQMSDYVCNSMDWEAWHRNWLLEHPDQIDWSKCSNGWLPRTDFSKRIAKRELQLKMEEEYSKNEVRDYLSHVADKDIVNEFYAKVMQHQGPYIHAYANRIGSEVCMCNYYHEEPELSAMEQAKAEGSFRKVFSISRSDKIQFISIDFKHGMLEFHDETGDHKGEYRIDGTPNKDADVNHSLKCVAEWRRRTGR